MIITPEPGRSRAELEDDWHWMAVTLHHADGVVTRVEGEMNRGPWSTCPGALAQVRATFEGQRLSDFVKRGDKSSNCTHLYDLALWAAAHADETEPTVYDVSVSDPVEGRREAVMRRGGQAVFEWTLEGQRIVAPEAMAGRELTRLGDWISGLDPAAQEAARLFRWVSMMSMGRAMVIPARSSAARFASGACFTFQPERAEVATRVDDAERDFSRGDPGPLAGREIPPAAP